MKEYNTREYNEIDSFAEPTEHHSIYTDYVKVVVSRARTPRYSDWVGGELYSVNKLAVLAPFLALITIAAVATVYVVKSRRRA